MRAGSRVRVIRRRLEDRQPAADERCPECLAACPLVLIGGECGDGFEPPSACTACGRPCYGEADAFPLVICSRVDGPQERRPQLQKLR